MSDPGQSYRFPKREKLVSKKNIEELFKNGSSFYLRPLLVKYHSAKDQTSHQLLFSVSKRNFKRAVDRNLIKRRMREAYRLNRHLLITPEGSFYHIAFVYVDKSIVPYDQIEVKLKKLLKRLSDQSLGPGKNPITK
ncbi:ribonuclease P protein component [Marinoscillum sp.]|uniref:ribonuclease P protein component n=1 Tax=Marinoscillum sp. TaxID=2024838 RepID=UPI003BAB149F